MDPAAELGTHPLFMVLSVAARRTLQEAAIRRRVRRAEIIYAPGAAGDAAYLVRRGWIKVSRLSSDGREITLCLCQPGELFGEEALVDGGSRACQAQALEEGSLLVLSGSFLQQLLREEAAFSLQLARLIGQRREAVEDQVEDLAFRDVGGRLARFLIQLSARQAGHAADGRTLLTTRLTHQELANCIGTTRETLTLTIDRFKADGWIELEGRIIAICNLNALRERAGVRIAGDE